MHLCCENNPLNRCKSCTKNPKNIIGDLQKATWFVPTYHKPWIFTKNRRDAKCLDYQIKEQEK